MEDDIDDGCCGDTGSEYVDVPHDDDDDANDDADAAHCYCR